MLDFGNARARHCSVFVAGIRAYSHISYYNPDSSLCQYFDPANSNKTKKLQAHHAWGFAVSLVGRRSSFLPAHLALNLREHVFACAEMQNRLCFSDAVYHAGGVCTLSCSIILKQESTTCSCCGQQAIAFSIEICDSLGYKSRAEHVPSRFDVVLATGNPINICLLEHCIIHIMPRFK